MQKTDRQQKIERLVSIFVCAYEESWSNDYLLENVCPIMAELNLSDEEIGQIRQKIDEGYGEIDEKWRIEAMVTLEEYLEEVNEQEVIAYLVGPRKRQG